MRLPALYCAQIVLGAGVLTVTFQTVHLGLLVILAGLVIMALIAGRMYSRVATAAMDASSGTSGSALTACGGGSAGRRLAAFGLGVYALGASIGYICLGVTGLHGVVELAGSHPRAGAGAFASITLLAGLLLRVPATARHDVLLRLAMAWCPSLAICVLLPQASNAACTIGFVVGVIVLRQSRRHVVHSTVADAHRASVQTMRTQLILMLVLAAGCGVLLLRSHQVIAPHLLPTGLTGSAALQALGVLIFAMVGCGHGNLSSYDIMRDVNVRDRVIASSMRIVLVVVIGWVLVTSLELSPSMLATLDANRSFTTAGLASVIARHSMLDAPAALAANIALLLAVTGATSGFLEGFALEISERAPSAGGTTALSRPSVDQLVVALLMLAAGGAGVVEFLRLSTSEVLSSTGTVGGAVILFVLPMLCERDVTRRRRMARLASLVAVLAALAGGYGALTSSSHPMLAVINLAVSAVLLPLTALAARSVSASGRPAAISAPRPGSAGTPERPDERLR